MSSEQPDGPPPPGEGDLEAPPTIEGTGRIKEGDGEEVEAEPVCAGPHQGNSQQAAIDLRQTIEAIKGEKIKSKAQKTEVIEELAQCQAEACTFDEEDEATVRE